MGSSCKSHVSPPPPPPGSGMVHFLDATRPYSHRILSLITKLASMRSDDIKSKDRVWDPCSQEVGGEGANVICHDVHVVCGHADRL